ncbi:MAG: low specificity L-threonine aldolase [Oscillospiraceae bacterium]|nr:low specificity L-threonine aldolase [Oscillospiraceae bacterium]
MIRFNSDYTEGAHPEILRLLEETNFQQTEGYGMDEWCEKARDLIRKACEGPEAEVHFLVGGTQTNATVIAAALRPYEGAISADTGHIHVHETGAVEHTGHKVLALPSVDGKINAGQVRKCLEEHFASPAFEHTVRPGMVYISYPTEYGTIYTKEEMEALHGVCREYGIPLFVDGARLGYGLACSECDVTLPEFARLCDIFYIGGTKVGALFGEAVVVPDPAILPNFRYMIKQGGGMLAKGRLLGIQFTALFTDDLYMKVSKHAIEQSDRIRAALKELGYRIYIDSPTNQQFFVIDKAKYDELTKEFALDLNCFLENGEVVARACTSWATKEENVDRFIDKLKRI